MRYIQLAHNFWDPELKQARAKILYNFGREDELDSESLERLVESLSRFLTPGQALEAKATGALTFLGSTSIGTTWVLDHLWHELGISDIVSGLAAEHGYEAHQIERKLFALVAQRALGPGAQEPPVPWTADGELLPSSAGTTISDTVTYDATSFLLESEADVQREVFERVAQRLGLDTRLLYFSTMEVDVQIDRSFGVNGTERATVGLVGTRSSVPLGFWHFSEPGQDDPQRLMEVREELAQWLPGEVVWVAHRHAATRKVRRRLAEQDLHWITGGPPPVNEYRKLHWPGRYSPVNDTLEIKRVWVGEGERRRAFVICRKADEVKREQELRERVLTQLQEELDALQARGGPSETEMDELLSHPLFGRYLVRRGDSLVIDRAQILDAERVEGRYFLTTSSDELTGEDLALGYDSLVEAERIFAELNPATVGRPAYLAHERRIHVHIILSWLAMLLVVSAESRAGRNWSDLRAELDAILLGEFSAPIGRILRRTETTPEQGVILDILGVPEPPEVEMITHPPD